MANIIPIFKQDDNTTLTIIGRSLCFLISKGSFRKYCLKELSLLLNRRICSLHPNMAFARHILLSMQPRYCECNTDKYEQPFILMWDFHWSEKGFWPCRSRNSFAQVRSLRFSRHYKHLVSSYLQGRTQTTQIGPHISERLDSTCRVPQGSVLGPLLFLLYMNDIQESSDKLSFYLFADDTNILFANKNLKSFEFDVNHKLNKVYDWLIANKLTFNIKKSNFVILCPAQR